MPREALEGIWTYCQSIFGTLGAATEWTGSRHFAMHKTETVDYIVVLDGEPVLWT